MADGDGSEKLQEEGGGINTGKGKSGIQGEGKKVEKTEERGEWMEEKAGQVKDAVGMMCFVGAGRGSRGLVQEGRVEGWCGLPGDLMESGELV